MNTKSTKSASASLLVAFTASLCCITPVLALFSGVSGIAATFTWMEPLRPYLIGSTVLVLGFAWYQKMKPRTQEEIECDCDEDEKEPFLQSKTFLGIVTAFAIILLTFPSYSHIFYGNNDKELVVTETSNFKQMNLEVEGMTCVTCNETLEHATGQVAGVFKSTADFETGTAVIEYDASISTPEEIIAVVNETGYLVTGSEISEISDSNTVDFLSAPLSGITQIELAVEGMTCTGCEGPITHSVNELDGVVGTKVSYEDGTAVVQFDKSKTSLEEVISAINETGYTVVEDKKSDKNKDQSID